MRTVRVAARHDEVAGGDCSVQHHILARHGEFHGVFVAVVAALAVAIVDGLAVQAVDFGVGGDGHGSVFVGVGVPNRRHIVDSHDLGFGGGCIPGDGVETCYPVQTCLAVEHAASHVAGFLGQARREDSAKDLSYAAVFYLDREDAVLDDAGVCHTARALEGSTSDVSRDVVCHCSFKETTADGVVVCHGSIEGAVLYSGGGVVCHFSIEGAFLDGAAVCHGSIEGAVLDGAVVCHTACALEGTARDFSSGVVGHCCIEGTTGYGAFVCHGSIEGSAHDFS